MEIEQNIWGFTPEGEAVVIYTMRNTHGAEIRLTNLGAAIVGITVPDRDGKLEDVVLGYDRYESYLFDGPNMGKTVGRYANRIAYGRFSLDGVEYQIPPNNPPNQLHGGPKGFGNLLWESRVEVNRVVFSVVSPDGDQGFPGELSVEAVYDWDDRNTLEITLLAKSEAPTVVNLTNHAYFNLAGESSGTVLGQTLQLDAGRYLPTDRSQIPTGEFAAVEGTPMDFRREKPLGQDIDADFEALGIGSGYDHCWLVDGWDKGRISRVGELRDAGSGRTMEIFSSQPGVQVYTGNFLKGSPRGKNGSFYTDRDGVAIECQGLPDAPNHPQFPTQRLNPDQIYEERIIYRFGVK